MAQVPSFPIVCEYVKSEGNKTELECAFTSRYYAYKHVLKAREEIVIKIEELKEKVAKELEAIIEETKRFNDLAEAYCNEFVHDKKSCKWFLLSLIEDKLWSLKMVVERAIEQVKQLLFRGNAANGRLAS